MAANKYKNKYSDKLFPYVKERLIKDGRKASDSTVKTAISDMFYLERQMKEVDFLFWFSSLENLSSAKEEIIKLLKKADRKNSSLNYDIQWYSRLLDYFYDYYNNNA